MPKKAVSVTLEEENLAWLRGQAVRIRARGLSQTLDRLVTSARLGGRVADDAVRSVVGTVDLPAGDPALDDSDGHLRALFAHSLHRALGARAPGRRPSVGLTGSGRGKTRRRRG